MIRFLVERGANLETRDQKGRTPLLVEAWQGNAWAARTLIELGAKTDARNPEGKTALELARAGGAQLPYKPNLVERQVRNKTIQVLEQARVPQRC